MEPFHLSGGLELTALSSPKRVLLCSLEVALTAQNDVGDVSFLRLDDATSKWTSRLWRTLPRRIFLTPYGSVYHSRRNCGNLKRPKLFLPCMVAWSVGMTNHQRSLKIVCCSPLIGSEFLKTWLRCPRRGMWNCFVSELVFGLEFFALVEDFSFSQVWRLVFLDLHSCVMFLSRFLAPG